MKNFFKELLSRRTRSGLKFDILRFKARTFSKQKPPTFDNLHFGCGKRKIQGWLNVDVVDSDFNIDLAAGKLPFQTNAFKNIVSQQVIEHIDLFDELMPLLTELNRTLVKGGEIWLACPDLEKICNLYVKDKGESLFHDRLKRWPDFTLKGAPSSHIVNVLFHQDGQHKNLFDFELLKWVLETTGFTGVKRVNEQLFLKRYPMFPLRNDDFNSLYVTATK